METEVHKIKFLNKLDRSSLYSLLEGKESGNLVKIMTPEAILSNIFESVI